jgi:hypothetical protein
MLSAAHCAYSIDPQTGVYTPPAYFNDAVGWSSGPVAISSGSGDENIDACLVGQNVDGIVIAFRGTIPPARNWSSLFDWFQDIFMVSPSAQAPLPGKVHTGFWDAVQAIWSQIVPAVQDLLKSSPDAKLYITGHSKGGAMAILAAALIAFTEKGPLPSPAAVYTFAAPHAGNSDFASGFPLSTIPVTPYEGFLDVVPFLPPTPGFFEIVNLIPDLPAWLTSFFNQAEGWNYSALDTTYFYIQKDHTVVPNTALLTAERVAEIVGAMVTLDFSAIAAAHSTACGSTYTSGVCPSLICSQVATA